MPPTIIVAAPMIRNVVCPAPVSASSLPPPWAALSEVESEVSVSAELPTS